MTEGLLEVSLRSSVYWAAVKWREARRVVLAEPVADVRKSQSFESALAELANAEEALVKAVDNSLTPPRR